jgi:hypothetical protein
MCKKQRPKLSITNDKEHDVVTNRKEINFKRQSQSLKFHIHGHTTNQKTLVF